MFKMHLLFVIVVLIVQSVAVDPSPKPKNQTIKSDNSQVTLAEAKHEALKDTTLALKQFESLVKSTFSNGSSGSLADLLFQEDTTNDVPTQLLKKEELNWSVLDDLPICSNETVPNNTMCIEKSDSQNSSSVKYNSNPEEEELDNLFKKRQLRKTRELETVSRKVRAANKKKRGKTPAKKKRGKKPAKNKRGRKTAKNKRGKKGRNKGKKKRKPKGKWKNKPKGKWKNNSKNKPKGKPRKKANTPAEKKNQFANAVETKNRLYGHPNQIKEQKRRMRKNMDVYLKFNKHHQCNKKKLKWYKKPWKKLQLYFRVVGQHVRLPCNVCVRPDENVDDYNLRWKRRPTDRTEMEEMNVLDFHDKDSEESRFSWRPGGILNIDGVEVDDTGQYLCLQDNEYEAVHFLEVTNNEPTEQVVGKMLKKEYKGKSPKKESQLKKHNLRVFTKWDPWTPCSRCDARGKMRRFGICFVKKIDQSKPVKPKDVLVFKYFPKGLACRSNLLPEYIQKMKGIRKRKSEVHTKYCHESCPSPPKEKVIRGKNGKKVDVIQSSKGYKKFKKKLDKFPKLVRRKTIYVVEGGKAEVTCVSKIKPTAIIRWQKGFKILDPVELPRTTNKRMEITVANKLLISDVLKSDKGIYSCWTDGTLRKTTKLKVYTAQRKGIKDKIAYVGVALCAITILLILKDIGKNRKKGRKPNKQAPAAVKA